MGSGVTHAAEKIATRGVSGHPIPGKHEVTIRVSLSKGWNRGASGRIEISPNGDRVLITARTPPSRIAMSNIFDEFAEKIGRSPKSNLLDRVNIVDASSGALLAQYENAGGGWKRVR